MSAPYSNQFFIGGNDPLLNPNEIQMRMKQLQDYKEALERQGQSQQQQPQQAQVEYWKQIDGEIQVLNDEQKNRIFLNEEYQQVSAKLQQLVQEELLGLVKGKIEASPNGQELLKSQLDIVQKLKKNVVEESNREMELFKLFRDYSKQHPDVTYEEFIKSI